MVETHPERRDCGDDISLSGTRGPGNPRRHSGREAGIQGRESNLAVTIGAKVARAVTLPGLGPGFPAGTTNHPHQNPNHPHQNPNHPYQNLAPARFFYVWAILFRARWHRARTSPPGADPAWWVRTPPGGRGPRLLGADRISLPPGGGGSGRGGSPVGRWWGWRGPVPGTGSRLPGRDDPGERRHSGRDDGGALSFRPGRPGPISISATWPAP